LKAEVFLRCINVKNAALYIAMSAAANAVQTADPKTGKRPGNVIIQTKEVFLLPHFSEKAAVLTPHPS